MPMLSESDAVFCLGVKKRIQEPSVLKRIVLKSPLQDKAALFQNARRSGIVRIRARHRSDKAEILRSNSLRTLGSLPSLFRVPKIPDPAKSRVRRHVDGRPDQCEYRCRQPPTDRHRCKSLLWVAPSLRGARIHLRRRSYTDAEINRAAQARRGGCLHVSRARPRRRDATRESCIARERAASLFLKLNSGLLHFAIRQEPNQ